MRCLFLFASCLLWGLVTAISDYPILIVISYDAFRYDYFNRNASTRMLELRQKGTYSPFMKNVFPTKTFPNHFSIVTGLYAENHGVVDNSYHDPETGHIQNYSYEMFHYDDRVIPIWRLNEDFGPGRYSGCMMWPGCGFAYQGKYPTYLKDFQLGYSWKERADTIFSWIENPEKPANLIMLYIEQPDYDGHIYGPESQVVQDILKKLDNFTAYLEEQLELKGLTDKVNVIHLSDHGMASVTPDKIINVTKFLPEGSNNYKLAGSSPTMHFVPDIGYENFYYEILKNASETNGHFRVYRKRDMPERWHFKNNERTPPIFLLAEKGYAFQDLSRNIESYIKRFNITVTNDRQFGLHGYDTEMEEMRPFFMARGPRIKVNHTVKPFNNVDLYSLFCEILSISPVHTDGSFENVRDIVTEHDVPLFPLIIVITKS